MATASGAREASGAFTRYAPRRRLTPAAADRHSQIVRTLRLVVPALATGLVTTYAFSAVPSPEDAEFLRQFRDAQSSDGEVVLEQPRYVGETLEGVPFEVSAREARRSTDAPNLVRLSDPETLRDTGAEGQVRVRASGGLLDTDANVMDLDRDVRVVQGIGGRAFTLTTERARLDLEGRTVTTDAPVSGRGESGEVAADSLTVYEEEGRAVLRGNARLVLNPSRVREDADGDEAGQSRED